MKNKKISFSEELYKNHLSIISGIKFTSREIDIMACFLNGRNTDTTASLLDISSRTVETHLSNVMFKLGCNSRQSVILFIEKSHVSSLLHTYYKCLLASQNFKIGLKKVSSILKGKKLSCAIVYLNEDYPHHSCILRIQSDLSLSGITTYFYMFKDLKSLNVFSQKKKLYDADHFFYVGSKDLLDQLKLNLKQKNDKSISKFIILDKEKKLPTFLNKEKEMDGFLFQEQYCLFCIEILKNIFLDINIQEMFSDFILCEKDAKQELFKNNQKTMNVSEIISKKSYVENYIYILNSKKYLLGALFFIFILGLCWIFFFEIEAIKGASSNRTAMKNIIQSDLRIPEARGLLDRSELIKKIEEQIKINYQAEKIKFVGIVGIGGSGKTTLAREFVLTKNAPVIWEINAETKESLIASFKELAYALAKTPEEKNELGFILAIHCMQEKELQLLLTVKNWLKAKFDWILIYDNVENFSEIKKYFPTDSKVWGSGTVIITSRDTNIQNTSYIKTKNIVHLNELTKDESLNLFSKILFDCEFNKLEGSKKEDLSFLFSNIPPFPLDVSVAAYYIKNNNITYKEYLERILHHGQNFEEAQESLLREISDYSKTRDKIIILSLQNLINLDPEFKELLFFIFILNSQNIPKSLLESYKDSVIVDKFIYNLKKHSLITTESSDLNKSDSILSLHRSTQRTGFLFLLNFLTSEEQKDFMEKAMSSISSFYNNNLKNGHTNKHILINQLDSLQNNLNHFNLSKNLKDEYEIEILLMLGNTHFKVLENLLSAEKYFQLILKKDLQKKILSNKTRATLLKDYAYICKDTGCSPDVVLTYCKESINLCKDIPNSDELIAENFQLIGYAYTQKHNFKETIKAFKNSLDKIKDLKFKLKNKMTEDIYGLLALSSSHYLNRADETSVYADDFLRLINLNKLRNNKNQFSCQMLQHKTRLGRAYNRLGLYEKSMKLAFNECQNWIDTGCDNQCPQKFFKKFVQMGIGEALLRLGNLDEALKRLSDAVLIGEKLGGRFATLEARALRAETLIRLDKLDKAFEDCQAIFNIQNRPTDNSSIVTYSATFYHAAVIHYKKGDLIQAQNYFVAFFENIKKFSEYYFDEENYNALVSKDLFVSPKSGVIPTQKDIKNYLNCAAQIFSAIYGSNHPFVTEYVMKN